MPDTKTAVLVARDFG
ncbi:hypothetical protein A7Y37_RS28805, partial [Escherichia coli]